MVSHRRPGDPPRPGPRTWRPWRSAWLDAAYSPTGFWSTQQPGGHFSTAVRAGPLVAQAVAALVPASVGVVVDVGAGDARLLAHLADLLPGVALVGVDRRVRPEGLDPRVGWFRDHFDVERERWTNGGPDAWSSAGTPFLVAHEWLDDLPVPVVGRRAGTWHEVEVDGRGHERPGAAVGAEDRAWLADWWESGSPEVVRAEVGRARDAAWAVLVRWAVARGGRALAVDYGHLATQRPVEGSLLAYGRGRQRAPVPDGSVNLTAAVAVDALVRAGEDAGAETLLLERQSAVLGRHPEPAPADPLGALVRRSEQAALTAPGRWGDLWWLLQGARAS
ncbi:SAM-dependent methyltransferase [Microlunatus spumicola]|uniref:SAM-dependent methyltransferase n=1 Tax=Microlunatus spumicola TaxID=81499 RepID=A0ABP6XYW7_9ACTN